MNPTPPTPGWADAELTSPHTHAEKAGKVRGMFTAIAVSYDLNNRLHSLWQDVRWRNFAVKQAQVKPGEVVLDVACGTGDLTQAFAQTPASKVTGLDFTPAMLDQARIKQHSLPAQSAAKVTYIEGDAMALPLPDASTDVVSIAFGIRNVTDSARALREFARVLRPGGRLVVLEFERPKNPVVRWFNDAYCGQVMPRTATLISGDKSGAYKYLPKSVATYVTREQMLKNLADVGFVNAQAWPLSLGICVCYRALKAP
ncbi:MAG: bifunctional demethylmenaquinone methyltransferase/2-methoxy-6-polyprenyl-1,4-benzoquinol methylase UbiE [Phycisphaerales bacterium]